MRRFLLATLGAAAAFTVCLTTARAEPRFAVESGSVEDGYFFDVYGQRRPFRPVQQAWFAEFERRPYYVRAAVELAIFLGVQTISYWARPAANRFDWDDPAFEDRFNGSAVRFDNNRAFTNFLLHPISGGASYWIARTNDVSVPISALYSIVASMIWEFGLEWREEVSVNDLIATPLGGIPVGAFASALTDYLSSSPSDRPPPPEAARVPSSPRVLHPWRIDPNSGPGRLPADALGFSSAFWHRFRVGFQTAGVAVGDGRDRLNGFEAAGEIVSMAGFLRPGRFEKVFVNDTFTDLHFRLGFTPHGASELEFRTNATLVGRYSQNFRAVRHGVAGHGEMFGLGTGVQFVERTYAHVHDMYASVSVAGLSGGLWLGFGPLRVRVLGEARYDFGAAQSLALPRYKREHPNERLKSVLEVQGYDYGIGPWGRVRAEATAYGVSFGAYANFGMLRAIGGLDRWEAWHTHEVNGRETVFESGSWLRYDAPRVPVYVGGTVDFTVRTSTLGDVTTDRNDTRIGASAGFGF